MPSKLIIKWGNGKINGQAGDVSEELKNFLLYVADKKVSSKYTERLEQAVERVRKHEEWRVEYMTLAMKYLEKKEEGREEGTLSTLYSLVEDGDLSIEKASKKANLTTEEFRKRMLFAGYSENKTCE